MDETIERLELLTNRLIDRVDGIERKLREIENDLRDAERKIASVERSRWDITGGVPR